MAWGLLPSEVLDIPADDYDLLQMYWDQEPWGPWRDNFHAALIAQNVLKAGHWTGMKMDHFFFKRPDPPAKIAKDGKASFIGLLKAVAVRVKRKKGE